MSVYIGGTKVAGLEKELPAQAGNAGKYLYTDGQNASWEEASTAQIWIGTQAEYEALGTYDPEVVYQVTDDFQNLIPNIGQITEDVNDLKAHAVVEFQVPTAANNYTWYRLYADGWVEMGGYDNTTRTTSSVTAATVDITFPVAFADTNYSFVATPKGGYCGIQEKNSPVRSTTGLSIDIISCYPNTSYTSDGFSWQVSGMAA